MSDRLRMILITIITALICGMMVYASFVHVTL